MLVIILLFGKTISPASRIYAMKDGSISYKRYLLPSDEGVVLQTGQWEAVFQSPTLHFHKAIVDVQYVHSFSEEGLRLEEASLTFGRSKEAGKYVTSILFAIICSR